MTTCKYVYLDIDGKPSSIYYDTLKKHGQEAAERAYVTYMLGTGIKFSKDQAFGRSSVEDIIHEADQLKLSKDETKYVDKVTLEEATRITDVVKSLKMVPNEEKTGRMPKPAFDEIAISERMAKQEIEEIVIANSNNSVTRKDVEKLDKAYKEYLEKHPDVNVEDRAALIRSRWAAGAAWGDFFHALFQEYFTAKSNPDYEDYSKNAVMGMAINAVQDRFPDIDSKGIAPGMVRVVNKVLDFIEKIKEQEKIQYGEEQTFRIVPELRLKSRNLETNVAGTSDLVIFSTSGNAYVLDFKTKSEESARNMFMTSTGRFGGPFINENLDDNPANSARVQMAYYAAILEEHGYRVPATYTVMIEGEMQRNAAKNTWGYVGIESPQILHNSSLHHLLEGNASNRQELLTSQRESGIDGFVEEIANEGDNHNLRYVSDNEDVSVRRRKQAIRTDKDGRRFILRENPMLPNSERELYIDSKTDQEIDTILRNDYRVTKEEKLHVANDVIQYFENEGVVHGQHKLKHREEIAGMLLRGISKHTHTLMKADRYDPTIGDAGNDVLVAVNKATGAISLLSVITASKSKIKFGEIPNDKRSSIFGKYATNRAIKLEKASAELLEESSSHDFHAMKLGLVALKLKNKSTKPLLIENMKVATIAGGDAGKITTTYIKKEIQKLQILNKYLPEDVKNKFSFVGDLLTKPSNIRDDSYGLDTVEMVKSIIMNATGSVKLATTQTEIGRILDEKLRNWSQGQVIPYSLITELVKFRKELVAIKKMRSENIQNDPTILAIDKALVQLGKFDIFSKQLIRNRFSRQRVRTAMTSGDAFVERAQVLYNTASANIRDEFKSFDFDHKDLLRGFLNEAKQFGLDSSDKAFKSIFVDPSFSQGNQENWMKLKSEDDPSLDNRPAAKAYIKFFNDTVEKQFKRSMTPAQFKSVETGVTWTRGMIPIVHATKSMSDAKTWKSMDAWVDSLKSNIKAMEKASYDPQISNTFDFNKMDAFTTQAGFDGAGVRNDMMGIESSRKVVPSRDLEMNLAAVLNNIVITSSESEHMGNTLIIVDASLMNVFEELEKSNPDMDTESTQQYLKNWTSMVINNKYSEEGKENDPVSKLGDALSKGASTVYFSASIKQATTELLTGTFQTGSAMIANVITGMISKGEQVRFWPQDVAWAASCLDGKFDVNMQSKAFQITYDLGMTYADPAQLKQKEFYDAGKAKLFRSKPLFYLNQLFFNSSITNTALAEIRHKKIDRAYINEGTDTKPDWKYDETLDERFYVYSPDGENFGSNMKTVPPSTPEEKKKHALWLAVRNSLTEEGLIGENGRMKVPLTANEKTSMKYYATKLYGSFNKDKTKQEEMHVIGRSMLRYKDWFAQRIANYYTPTDMSISRGKFEWVEDPELEDGGIMQWKGIPNEGIIETLGNLYKEIAEHGRLSKPTDVQLENLGKLLADMLLLLMLMWPIAVVIKNNKDDKFLKSKMGKSLVNSYTNAISDIAIWKSLATMGDSVAPGVQMALTAGADAARSAFALATGDTDMALKKFIKVPEKIGGYNTFASLGELFND